MSKVVDKKSLFVKNTKRYGKGIFTNTEIKAGKIIYVLNGKRMDISDFVKAVNSGKERMDDPFQIGKRTYLDLDEFSRTFNHSCDPNAGLRKNSELFALRDIKIGEEITYDYSTTVAPTKWKMQCRCGAKNCRKVVGDILSVPKNKRENYQRKNALQRYMKILLASISRHRGRYILPKYEIVALERLKKINS